MAFTENNHGGTVFMTASNISAPHAFTTRYGGVSKGCFSSMNLGENRGDDSSCVAENYRTLCDAVKLPFSRIVVSKQVHETTVRAVTEKDIHILGTKVGYEADGLVTDIPMLPLFIYTADCIPVLLYDPVRGAVGAVHAGWRSAVGNITGIAVEKMKTEYGCKPENIRCAIGPGIDKCCFETGHEVPDAVTSVLGSAGREYFTPANGGKFIVDLKGVNRALLIKAGILPENIDISCECTMCLHDKYWSHRYTGGKRGSQASVIMLKGKAQIEGSSL